MERALCQLPEMSGQGGTTAGHDERGGTAPIRMRLGTGEEAVGVDPLATSARLKDKFGIRCYIIAGLRR